MKEREIREKEREIVGVEAREGGRRRGRRRRREREGEKVEALEGGCEREEERGREGERMKRYDFGFVHSFGCEPKTMGGRVEVGVEELNNGVGRRGRKRRRGGGGGGRGGRGGRRRGGGGEDVDAKIIVLVRVAEGFYGC